MTLVEYLDRFWYIGVTPLERPSLKVVKEFFEKGIRVEGLQLISVTDIDGTINISHKFYDILEEHFKPLKNVVDSPLCKILYY